MSSAFNYAWCWLDTNEIPLSDAGVKFFCRNCGREGHRRHYCPELKNGSIDRRFKCGICGGKGHNRRTCLKSSSINAKSIVKRGRNCKVCHRRGHNRRTCPKVIGVKLISFDVKKGLYSSRRRKYKCRLCQEIGHNIRTCPSRNVNPW